MSKAEEVRELAAGLDPRLDLLSRPIWLLDVQTALRAYADLLEKREREERLLRSGWVLRIRISNGPPRQWLWRWTEAGEFPPDFYEHPDRATAAKLAEEKMNGPA